MEEEDDHIPANLELRFQEYVAPPVTENENEEANETPPNSSLSASNSKPNPSSDQTKELHNNGKAAPPTHQYNKHNESAGATPP